MKKSDFKTYASLMLGSVLLIGFFLWIEDTTSEAPPPAPVSMPKTALELEQEKLVQARERRTPTKIRRAPVTDEILLIREEARRKQAELDRAHELARLQFERDEEELAAARRELASAKAEGESEERIQELKATVDRLLARCQAEIEESERQAAASNEAKRQSESRQRRMQAQLDEIDLRRSVRNLRSRKSQVASPEEKSALEQAERDDMESYAEIKRQLDEEREQQTHKTSSPE